MTNETNAEPMNVQHETSPPEGRIEAAMKKEWVTTIRLIGMGLWHAGVKLVSRKAFSLATTFFSMYFGIDCFWLAIVFYFLEEFAMDWGKKQIAQFA